MKDGMNFVLTNMLLTTTLLAILLSLFNRHKSPSWAYWLLKFTFLFPIGVQCLWAFTFHVFFSGLTADAIIWEYSPFEYEVGLANLGLGLMGFYAYFYPSKGSWITTTLMSVCLIGGSGLGYIYQSFVGNILEYHHLIPIILIPIIMIESLRRSYSTLK